MIKSIANTLPLYFSYEVAKADLIHNIRNLAETKTEVPALQAAMVDNLTDDQLNEVATEHFAAADLDGNGFVSWSEVMTLIKLNFPQHQKEYNDWSEVLINYTYGCSMESGGAK